MNLFKRTTASVALIALVSSVFTTGVSAASSDEIAAASALATKGYINTQSNVSDYNLDMFISRAEISKVAANVAELSASASCENKFADVSATTPNDWVCGYVEALLANGFVSANANYNPNANLTKAEAVKLMLTVAGEEVAFDASTWQADFVAYAVENGFVSNFSDYNTAATRGFVFSVAAAATSTSTEEEGGDDILSELDKLLSGDDEDDMTDTEDDTTTVVVGNGELEVSLSATTPEGMDITKDAKAVNVLEIDVTAGNEDVSITGLELERTGFGSAAADQVAVFSKEGRVSKEKSFNSDDVANVTFSPAFVVKAGETQTLTVRVNVGGEGEFAVKVNEMSSSANVELGMLEGNTFDAKDTEAAVLEVKNEGVNSTVTSGETQADIVEFNLKNEGSASTSADVDVVITSVTLKEIGSVDHEDFLENLTLSIGGNELATVSSMNGKYVTFEFDGVTIDDGKNETFKVTADITGGAGDAIQFELDSVVDIVANASRYNSVNVEMDTALTSANGAFDSISVEAGELTIYAIDSEKDKIRGDKDDVVLGQLKIVNVAGKNLELDNLKVNIDLAGASTASVDELEEILENVEFEINGTSYDLNVSGNFGTINGDADYSETDLDIVLPQGTTILTVRADTLKDLDDNTTLTMTLADAGTATTGGLVVVETDDDENVGDISPSSLSWDAVEVENASVTVSNVPLANVNVVKGSSDLVALQFEVEAGEASSIVLDEVKVLVEADTPTVATKDEISEVALYKGSVSDANVLDRVSGSKLASGVATFDGFELTIDADETETFIVTVSTVDTSTVVGKVIRVSMDQANLSLEDDENDTITLASATLVDKLITVQDSGSLTLVADVNNDDNDDVKTILAGEESTVYSADVLATNEEVNVETVKFTTNTNLKTIVKSAKLYLDDTLVATASNSDVSDSATSVITFDNISNLDIDTTTQELKLALVTEAIGFEKIGSTVSSVLITTVEIEDAKGVDSNEDVTVADLTVTQAKAFSVVPSIVTVSVVETLANGSAKIKVTVDSGNNTQDASETAPTVLLSDIALTNLAALSDYRFYNTDNVGGDQTTFAALSAADRTVSDEETFVIIPQTTTDGSTYTTKIAKDAVTYDVNGVASSTGLTTNMSSELDLGTKTY
jgi:hypothetical protein